MTKTLDPEQWRVLGYLTSLCGARAPMHGMLKSQEVSPDAVCGLSERGLVQVKLNGEDIEAPTPGLIKTHRRDMHLKLSSAGESYWWNDPHRVLHSLGRTRHGVTLTYLLGMILFEDVLTLHSEGLLYALAMDGGVVDLDGARQPWSGSLKIVLSGGTEMWVSAVGVRTTKTGQLYSDR